MQIIPSNFIGDFKFADNIHYNLNALKIIYDRCVKEGEEKHIRKVLVVQIVSILEVVLHDFFMRAVNNTVEGIPEVAQEFLDGIREKPDGRKRPSPQIDFVKKHGIFDGLGSEIYAQMHELRQLRNRIHIQNEKADFEPDDRVTFSEERLRLAEFTLAAVMSHLSKRYPRKIDTSLYVEDFCLPW